MPELYKVVLIGLDFAGKSSILKVLEGSYSTLDQLTPTVGTDRTSWEILGFKVINWDLGGQQQYREKYMANFEQILDQSNLLIFVVDMQDDNRFNEAGSYFDDVLNALDNLGTKCPIIICLHKVDPDILSNAFMITNLNWVTNLFSEYSSKHDVEIKVFITSIYSRKSLVEMFSYGISKLLPIGVLSQILQEYLQETQKLGVIGIFLFDMNFISIGNAFNDLYSKSLALRTLNAFNSLITDFKTTNAEEKVANFDIILKNDETYHFRLFQITELPSTYYLLTMGTDLTKNTDFMTIFHEKYVPLIDEAIQNLIKSVE